MTSIEKLKDTHIDKRCFIIGNGPSLNNYDLSYLEDEWVFVVNEFYNHPVWPKLKKCIYTHLSTESFIYTTDKTGINLIHILYSKWKFFHILQNSRVILILRDTHSLAYNKIFKGREKYYLNLLQDEHIQDGNYEWDISKGSCIAGTSVIESSLAVAQYMGFKNIYLLGCDCSSFDTNKGQVHFYTEENIPKVYHPKSSAIGDEKHILNSWKVISKLFKDRGINIYNLSKESKIDVFEYKDYKEVVNHGKE